MRAKGVLKKKLAVVGDLPKITNIRLFIK